MQAIAKVKSGITINEFAGTKQRFIVEFDDSTAAIFDSWDAAYQAGGFTDDDITS